MTIGEKIQYYRKQKGLSQEELGQLLTVSRQTVSQWETGQTSPTIDNLTRLKDVLGVSVDELLSPEMGTPGEPTEAPKEEQPLERYETALNAAEAKTLADGMTAMQKRNHILHTLMLLFGTFFIVLYLGIFLKDSFSTTVFSCLLILCLIWNEINFRKDLTHFGKMEKHFSTTTMTFLLYRDRVLVMEGVRGKEDISCQFRYSELDTVLEVAGFYLIYPEQGVLRLRKSLVEQGSVMEELIRKGLANGKKEFLNKKDHITLSVLGFLSYLSLCGMLGLISYPAYLPLKPWAILLYTIAALIFPVVFMARTLMLKLRGNNHLNHRLTGAIAFSVLILVIAGFSYNNSIQFYRSDEYHTMIRAEEFLNEVSSITGLSFPTPRGASCEDHTPTPDTLFIGSVAVYQFDDADLDHWLRTEADGRGIWISELLGMAEAPFVDMFFTEGDYPDRFAFYNVTDGEWNTNNGTGGGDYLLFFCDYTESMLYIYMLNLPANDEISLSSFFTAENSAPHKKRAV